MAMVSRGRSTLNPDAPLFVPAAVRQVEDFSPEWWQLVTTSTWFHDYWLSQQQGENGFFGNTADATGDIADMLPDSIDTDDDLLSMEAQYEQFLLASEMETMNTFSSPFAYNQMPTNGSEAEAEMLIRSLSLSKSTPRSQMETTKYPGNPVQPLSPTVRPHSTQQPR